MPNCAIYVCMHSIFAYEIPVNFLDHYKKQIQKEYPNSFINNLKGRADSQYLYYFEGSFYPDKSILIGPFRPGQWRNE